MLFWLELVVACLSLALPLLVSNQMVKWLGLTGAAVFSIAALWEYGKGQGWTRSVRYIRCGILVVMSLGIMCFIPDQDKTQDSQIASQISSEVTKRLTQNADKESSSKSDAFYIEVPIAMHGQTTSDMLISGYMVGYKDDKGYIASPINIILYVLIANKLSFTSRISGYTVEAGESMEGPWKLLMPIHIENRNVYSIPDNGDLKNVWIVRFEPELLSVLRSSDFQPREQRSAWCFFQAHDIDLSKIKFYKFRISDTAGEGTTKIVPIPSPRKGDVEVIPKLGKVHIVSTHTDISGFRLKYFY
jgi:hypothetical protein